MKVLIIDDNTEFTGALADILTSFGEESFQVHSPEDALSFLNANHRILDLILLDIEFGPYATMDGLQLLEKLRFSFSAIPVVMITGKGSIDAAVRATKLGAINFIEKSLISKDRIKEVINSAYKIHNATGNSSEIKKFLSQHKIIANSKVMLEIGDNIVRFGRTDLNILITGETGTGKRLVANAIHSISRRNRYPIVTVDIPNIPKELFQSELFGHVKGSFSGATETKKGLFNQANKGTLFLDEIGDLSLDLQANLLIPIEEKIVRKVGSVHSESIDIRFVSATDKELHHLIKEGRFREQLYHRLRECEIHLPPLSERIDDIPEIAAYYVQMHNQEFNDSKYISTSVIEYLQDLHWSGNVRELATVVRVALQTTSKETLEIADFHRIIASSSQAHKDHTQHVTMISTTRTLKEDLEETDKIKIEDTLRRTNGNVSKSAALLDISRETLHNKIRKYEINVQQYRIKKR